MLYLDGLMCLSLATKTKDCWGIAVRITAKSIWVILTQKTCKQKMFDKKQIGSLAYLYGRIDNGKN